MVLFFFAGFNLDGFTNSILFLAGVLNIIYGSVLIYIYNTSKEK